MPEFDAAIVQPRPVGDGVDVINAVKEDVENPNYPMFAFSPERVLRVLISFATDLREILAEQEGERHLNLRHAVALDLEARAQVGTVKYGTRLKTNNGRNAVLDAYQELLDLLNYTKQGILEGKL